MPATLRSRHLPSRGWLWVLSPLIICLTFAPLAFGGTRPWTCWVIDGLLALSFFGWLILLLVERRLPVISPWCWVPLLFLAVFAGTHWANPASVFYDIFWAFNSLEGYLSFLPGTVDQASTQEVVVHQLALLLGFLVLADGCIHSRVRWLVLKVLAFSGFVIALIGIFQKASNAEAMLWVEPDSLKYGNKLFFAAFRYHANAASFLNLCWPAAVVVYLHERDMGRGGISTSLWLTALLITVIGVFVNTSRAGQCLGALAVIIVLIRFHRSIFIGSKKVMFLLGGMILTLFVVIALPAFNLWAARWEDRSMGSSFEGRLGAYERCLRMLPEAGVYGFGPGTFRLVFPLFEEDDAPRFLKEFFWYHAHQDYLQTIIEWGFLGAAAWAIFYIGGISRGIKGFRRAITNDRMEYSNSCALIALFIVMLHAAVDFPFQIPAIQLPILVYMAILWSSGNRQRKRKKPA